MGGAAIMMGDLVLTGSEINPVMGKLLAEGVEVTALHNHMLRTIPPIFYMHVSGPGRSSRPGAKGADRSGREPDAV
jgi:hypothetical protein